MSHRAAGTKGREVCSSLKLLRILSPDALLTPKITLTLGNNRRSEMILSIYAAFLRSKVQFIVLEEQTTLNEQTKTQKIK